MFVMMHYIIGYIDIFLNQNYVKYVMIKPLMI